MVHIRFRWIEASLRYAGTFGVREKKAYRDLFGITESMVSRDQGAFAREFNARAGTLAVEKVRGRLREAISGLPSGHIFAPLPSVTQWMEACLGSAFETLPPIRRAEPVPQVTRAIIEAIRERRLLRIEYYSRGGGASVRTVSPHVVVNAVGRLHLRSWDRDRGASRDFVLSRITKATILGGLGYVPLKADKTWSQYAMVEVVVRKDEDEGAARLDYALDPYGRREQTVREALLGYVLNEGTIRERYASPVEVRPLARTS